MEDQNNTAEKSMDFKFLKRLDIFGLPVSINYKGKRYFRSKFGGILSLITIIVVLIVGGQ